MSTDNREIIRRVRIFSTLTDAECDAVLRVIKARRGEAGQALFKQGEPGSTMIIVAEGSLVAKVSSVNGDVEVARFNVGEVCGEMAVIDPAPRSATVSAVSRTLVYEFSREGLDQLKATAPGAASALVRAVIRDVTKRLRDINDRIEVEITGHAPARTSMAPDAPRSRRPSMMGGMGGPDDSGQRPSLTGARPSLAGGPPSQARPSISGGPPPSQAARPAQPEPRAGLGRLLDKLRGGG